MVYEWLAVSLLFPSSGSGGAAMNNTSSLMYNWLSHRNIYIHSICKYSTSLIPRHQPAAPLPHASSILSPLLAENQINNQKLRGGGGKLGGGTLDDHLSPQSSEDHDGEEKYTTPGSLTESVNVHKHSQILKLHAENFHRSV